MYMYIVHISTSICIYMFFVHIYINNTYVYIHKYIHTYIHAYIVYVYIAKSTYMYLYLLQYTYMYCRNIVCVHTYSLRIYKHINSMHAHMLQIYIYIGFNIVSIYTHILYIKMLSKDIVNILYI